MLLGGNGPRGSGSHVIWRVAQLDLTPTVPLTSAFSWNPVENGRVAPARILAPGPPEYPEARASIYGWMCERLAPRLIGVPQDVVSVETLLLRRPPRPEPFAHMLEQLPVRREDDVAVLAVMRQRTSSR